MKLDQYLSNRNLSTAEAARQLGVTRQHLGLVRNEQLPAGRKLALSLWRWSNGEIGIADHLFEKTLAYQTFAKPSSAHHNPKTRRTIKYLLLCLVWFL